MDNKYWQKRYEEDNTGWDVGHATPPITTYFDKVADKSAKILIPGCGNAYEAAYLWEQGFANVYLCDWAASPLAKFADSHPEFPKEQLINADFFKLEEGGFDFVVEQTFFCALPRNRRADYAKKVAELLKSKGKLVGLLFGVEFEREGPPFGGSKEEYVDCFTPHFSTVSIEPCQNSIPPRQGSELFIELIK